MTEKQGITFPPKLRTWDSLLLWASLSFVVVLAWVYLFLLASNMSVGSMSDMQSMHSWMLSDYFMMFIMWVVMMVGMMVPTAIRAVTIYARIANQAKASNNPVAATYWFVFGYVIVWTGFSVLAVLLQGLMSNLGMLSASMVTTSPYLGAGLLIAAGVYQFTPWKDTCLAHCQTPALYLAGRFGPAVGDGISLGIHHGAYCLGCCWLLMALLFVGGVMNLVWIAAITAFVLLEKLLPASLRVTQVGAVGMVLAGVVYLVSA